MSNFLSFFLQVSCIFVQRDCFCFLLFDMKHLLFVLDYYLPHHGGVETVFEQVISRLLKKWYRITLLTSRFDKKLPVFEQEWNLAIYRVGTGRFTFLFAGFWKGLSLLRRFPEIENIHASTYWSAIQSSLLAKIFHKRVILTVHEVFGKLWYLYKWFWRWFFYLSFERLLFCFPYDTYHCVSRYTMNSLRLLYGVPDKKIALVYNGVDYDFWNPNLVKQSEINERKSNYNPLKKTMCLYYGHAGKSKWLDILLESIPNVTENQKKQIEDLTKKDRDEMKKLREEMSSKMKDLTDSHRHEILNILTSEQKKFIESKQDRKLSLPEKQ